MIVVSDRLVGVWVSLVVINWYQCHITSADNIKTVVWVWDHVTISHCVLLLQRMMT